MTIYENIKAAISVKQAAEHYGLKVNRSGMTCCPFHNDRHPSLKLNEDYFFCFGCGAKGDVIDLVAKLFNLSNHEALQKLAADFGLDPKPPTAAAMVKPKRPYIRQFREDEMLCFRVLTDYLHLLEDWKVRYVHFKTPTDDYVKMFEQMEQDGVISTRGLKPDAIKYGELVFDVNSAYFYNHGGYEFAKQFYADAYKAAVEIVGGEQYILSAVMHADEHNRAMSEALGEDVYHYHLHEVYTSTRKRIF